VKKPLILVSTVAVLTFGIIGVVAVNNANAAVLTYTASLSGANNAPPQAISTDTGSATITIDTVTFQVCVVATITLNDANDAVTVNHIHTGVAGANGAVFIPLASMSFPSLNSCVTADATTTAAVVANPAGFYYNIHSTMFPLGAARGQLVLQAATTTVAPTTTPATVSPTSVVATVAPVAAANPTFTG
jgi:hypothetical protein